MPWMTGAGGASTSSGSSIASMTPGQPSIRNMYSLGSKSKAPTPQTTTTISTGSRTFEVPIADLIKHKYSQKNKNRKCKKAAVQLKEEEDEKLMLQSMMTTATTVTHAPLQGANTTAAATRTSLQDVAATTSRVPLQGATTGNRTLSGGIGSNREGVHSQGVGLIGELYNGEPRTEPPARSKAALAEESDNDERPELHESTASEVEEPAQQQRQRRRGTTKRRSTTTTKTTISHLMVADSTRAVSRAPTRPEPCKHESGQPGAHET